MLPSGWLTKVLERRMPSSRVNSLNYIHEKVRNKYCLRINMPLETANHAMSHLMC